MSRFTILHRIWFPRAFRLVLPTLGGEVIGQLKATPLVATITVMEIFGVSSKIRQDTFRVYEPLIFVAAVYFCLTFVITRIFGWIERQVPQKR
jgi:polar amino acid transport system permease protein